MSRDEVGDAGNEFKAVLLVGVLVRVEKGTGPVLGEPLRSDEAVPGFNHPINAVADRATPLRGEQLHEAVAEIEEDAGPRFLVLPAAHDARLALLPFEFIQP